MNRPSLVGNWRLKAYSVLSPNGERSFPFGKSPRGFLSYSIDGRMQVVGVANDRVNRADIALTNRDKTSLFDSLFAYAGTYEITDNRVVHHVDVSWNENWTGSHQTRFFKLENRTLTLTARLTDAANSIEQYYEIVWEKIGTTTPPALPVY